MPDHFQWNYTTFLNIVFLVGARSCCSGSPGNGATDAGGGRVRHRSDVRHAGREGERARAPRARRRPTSGSAPTDAGRATRSRTESAPRRLGSLARPMSQDRRHPRGGAEPLVRVLPAEDARGRAAARGDDPRARAAAPDVRVGHLRRGRHDARDDARHRHAHQPRDVADRDGAPHVRGAHARRADRHRDALRRRGHREHPRVARRPAQGSRTFRPAISRTRPTSSISCATSATSPSASRCIPRVIRRRPIARPTVGARPRSSRAPTSGSRSSSSSPTCGSSSSATCASTA